MKQRNSLSSTPSEADVAAKNFGYRLPGVSYQPFPALNLTDADYFDDIHFSTSKVYRMWNADLKGALEKGKSVNPKEMVFMLTGAVRTLKDTYDLLLDNWIRPLCSPPSCVAHIVTHFSLTDNRPDTKGDDPKGQKVTINHGIRNVDALFKNDTFVRHYNAPQYDIGSDEEDEAMDQIEMELGNVTTTHNRTVVSQLRILRHGDPRRYSMWFSRQWIWRFVKELERNRKNPFDFYAFSRPDLLWFLPSPTLKFFQDFRETEEEAWFHDSYYCDLPDTLAFLPTRDVAESYFSLQKLVEPGIACLGGPNFNTSAVENRLEGLNVTVEEDNWCGGELYQLGWSERILRRKISSNAQIRYLPAGSTILRPPDDIDCQPLHPKFLVGFAKHEASTLPFLSCLLVYFKIHNSFVNPFKTPELFRLHDQDDYELCLSRSENGTFASQTCEEGPSYHPNQVFARATKEGGIEAETLISFDNDTGIASEVMIENESDINIAKWKMERLYIYSSTALEKRRLPEEFNVSQYMITGAR